MATKVLIGDLPATVTVEEITEDLTQRGWPILKVDKVEEGSPDRLTFVIEVDIDAETAKIMADRANNTYYKGHPIRVYIPRFFE